MGDERIGFVPTGSSGPFTFGSTTTSFASLNDLSRSLAFEDDNSKFPRSQISATTAVATDHVFHSNSTSTTSASPQQYKKPLAWYDQVHPIPYPSSSSAVFKQEPLEDEWRYDEAEEESEDDNDNDEDDDREDVEDAPVKSIEADERDKKRRKRNKPTLSCRECVGKKMRVSLYSFTYSFSFLVICHLSYDPCKELAPL